MITEIVPIKTSGHKIRFVHYQSPRDFAKQTKHGLHLRGDPSGPSSHWAGGTVYHFNRGLRGEVIEYVDAARDKVKHFSNVALEDYAIDYDYNVNYGALDYGAMVAGNPACMYGATNTVTDKSPVDIYIDTWTRADVKASVMQARGIGLLALVQALSILRPVNAMLLKGSHFSPAKLDTVQLLQMPTMPMDIARASFMLCSPTINRIGMLSAIHAAHDDGRYCGSPRMRAQSWQTHDMSSWMADRRGAGKHLHITGMFDGSFWNSNERVIDWIKDQIAQVMG